jgi:hypothetical protein
VTNRDGVVLVYASRVHPSTSANVGTQDSLVELRENGADYGWRRPESGVGFDLFGWSSKTIMSGGQFLPGTRTYARVQAAVMTDQRVAVLFSSKGGDLYVTTQTVAGGDIYSGYTLVGNPPMRAVGWSLQTLLNGRLLVSVVTTEGTMRQAVQESLTLDGMFGNWEVVSVQSSVAAESTTDLPDLNVSYTLPNSDVISVRVDGILFSGMNRVEGDSNPASAQLEEQYARAKVEFYLVTLGCIGAAAVLAKSPSVAATLAFVSVCGLIMIQAHQVDDLKQQIENARAEAALPPPAQTPPQSPSSDPRDKIPRTPVFGSQPGSDDDDQPGLIEGVDSTPASREEVSVIA